ARALSCVDVPPRPARLARLSRRARVRGTVGPASPARRAVTAAALGPWRALPPKAKEYRHMTTATTALHCSIARPDTGSAVGNPMRLRLLDLLHERQPTLATAARLSLLAVV